MYNTLSKIYLRVKNTIQELKNRTTGYKFMGIRHITKHWDAMVIQRTTIKFTFRTKKSYDIGQK